MELPWHKAEGSPRLQPSWPQLPFGLFFAPPPPLFVPTLQIFSTDMFLETSFYSVRLSGRVMVWEGEGSLTRVPHKRTCQSHFSQREAG